MLNFKGSEEDLNEDGFYNDAVEEIEILLSEEEFLSDNGDKNVIVAPDAVEEDSLPDYNHSEENENVLEAHDVSNNSEDSNQNVSLRNDKDKKTLPVCINSKESNPSVSLKNVTFENPLQEAMFNKTEITIVYDRVIAEFKELVCGYCQKVVEDFRELSQHCNEVHKKPPLTVCCNNRLSKRTTLYDHVVKHHLNPNYFKCEKCEKILSNRYSFKSHMLSHDVIKEPKARCKICSKMLLQVGLKNHMLTHLPELHRKFRCLDCDKG